MCDSHPLTRYEVLKEQAETSITHLLLGALPLPCCLVVFVVADTQNITHPDSESENALTWGFFPDYLRKRPATRVNDCNQPL